MKDQEARKRIEILERKQMLDGLEQPKILVRYCPKCEHQTPQVSFTLKGAWSSFSLSPPYDYLCLVCGSKINCLTETVCRVVKEEIDEA